MCYNGVMWVWLMACGSPVLPAPDMAIPAAPDDCAVAVVTLPAACPASTRADVAELVGAPGDCRLTPVAGTLSWIYEVREKGFHGTVTCPSSTACRPPVVALAGVETPLPADVASPWTHGAYPNDSDRCVTTVRAPQTAPSP